MKNKTKLRAYLSIAVLAGLLAVGISVRAYSNYSDSPKVVVEGNYIEAQSPVDAISEPILGAVSGPDLPNPNCQSGNCTYTAVGNFIDASTTIFSMPSPFEKVTSTGAGSEVILRYQGGLGITAATTTVDLTRVEVTVGATTSYQLACGAATGPSILPTVSIVTTTLLYIPTSSVGVVENNLTVAQGGMFAVGTVQKIALSSAYPYFTCYITPSVAAGITNADNTFAGKVTVRFNHTR